MCNAKRRQKTIIYVSEDQEDTESNSRNDKDDTYKEEVYKVDTIVSVKKSYQKDSGGFLL